MRFRFHAACLVLALALAPGAALAEEIGRSAQGLQPAEIKASLVASRLVLASQQQEREIARAAGLEDLDQEIDELRRALGRLEDSERRSSLVVGPGGSQASAAAADETRRSQRRQKVFDGVSRIARTRATAADRVASLASPRQRRIAERAVAMLEEIEQEARAAVDAPVGERVARLGALQQRLSVDRYGLAAQPSGPPTPTLQLLPQSALHPIENLDAP